MLRRQPIPARVDAAARDDSRASRPQIPPRRSVGSRQLRVVERVEDPVPLRDVEIGLLRRHAPKPGAEQPGSEARLPASCSTQVRLAEHELSLR